MKINVAIVEDRTEFRELWREILQNTEGFSCVAVCDTVNSAIQNIPAAHADVVLMDINLLPNGSGIECIKKLKPLCSPDLQFMMFTVFEDDESIFEALKAGATGYILKNTSPNKVLDAIRDLHDGGAPMSASIARRVLTSFQPLKNTINGFEDDTKINQKESLILELLAKGLLYKEIAVKMDISINMVKQHLHTIYKKLHVTNRTEAINKFLKR